MTMLSNHYFKQKLRSNQYFPTADSSELYAALPENELIPERLLKETAAKLKLVKSIPVLEDIGAIKKIVGIHLEKYCELH